MGRHGGSEIVVGEMGLAEVRMHLLDEISRDEDFWASSFKVKFVGTYESEAEARAACEGAIRDNEGAFAHYRGASEAELRSIFDKKKSVSKLLLRQSAIKEKALALKAKTFCKCAGCGSRINGKFTTWENGTCPLIMCEGKLDIPAAAHEKHATMKAEIEKLKTAYGEERAAFVKKSGQTMTYMATISSHY